MTRNVVARLGAIVMLWPLWSGCTSLRELRRDQYAARPERAHVVVQMRDGTRHEFDLARFSADSLTGYRHSQGDGAAEAYDAFPLALDGVNRITTRQVDWYRTSLVTGVALGAILAAALSRSSDNGTSVPAPCPRCP